MAVLVKNYGAKIVKNAGDALIFYFPDSSDPDNPAAFKDILECFTTTTLARNVINEKLYSKNLPSVSYRISADYGRVEVATSTSSKTEDLFGSTVNICAKINSMAEPNGIVIGGDLYQIIKSFSFIDEYHFIELREGYSGGIGNKYQVYTIFSRNNNTAKLNISNIKQLFKSNEILKIEEDVGAKQKRASQPLLEYGQQKQHNQHEYSSNIMIVDDEPDILFTYQQFLSDEGYNVELFIDPQEALKHFVQLPDPSSYYRLVLLDIRMPRVNGLQLFNTIKTITPNTKIMFCSALDIAEELTCILPDIKNSDIIKKPVERESFINKINSMLNN